jgi:triacylglycerol esterase/lipase EstA (alpha/beta hydrolase family)
MARIINLIIVILEIIAFTKAIRKRSLKELAVYYTQISNLFAFISSLMLVILGQLYFVRVLRFLSVSMLAMTFFVTVFILVPTSGKVRELLFSGSCIYHHLLVPVLAFLSYRFAEDKVSLAWIWLPVTVTLIYGLLMLYLNAKDKADGPYPFFRIKNNGVKMTVIWMAALIAVSGVLSAGVGYRKVKQTEVKYVFVHGLAGWGSYDAINEFFPYWGLSGGSIIRYLNDHGYESYAASVDPTGSAWDRACELYAQLAGTRVDYGVAHSQAAGHERFGEDYTGRALIEDFDHSQIALIGHSFGGATIRVFSEVLVNGSEEERAATDGSDLSPFFRGGNGEGLVAVVTLAAPTNGTTAYDLYEDSSFDLASIEIPEEYEKNSNAVSSGTRPVLDGREAWDYASYDMHIDNALELNGRISTFEDVYYFAYPCSSMMTDENGRLTPDPAITENMFMKGAIYMSRYTGSTQGGFVLDESWQANDGLVNTVSAGAPFGAPQEEYSEGSTLLPGRWYVMPVYHGDHMSLQGGFTKRTDVKPFYMDLVKMIASVSE